MQKSDNNQGAIMAHRKAMMSTAVNRRNLQRPAARQDVVKVSIKNKEMKTPAMQHSEIHKSGMKNAEMKSIEMKRADMSRINERMRQRSETQPAMAPKVSAKEMKEEAIRKAMATTVRNTAAKEKAHKKSTHVHFGLSRVLLAMACAAAAVFAIVYFVNLNAPDISLKVAAMQTGIEASYPSYVPRDYSLADITSESGKITLNFRNASTGDGYSLIEEKSSWDSNALLSNYVKEEYGDNYTAVREQGLTLYISGSNAAWVNGGIVYKIKVTSGMLTKKQIRSIAVSL